MSEVQVAALPALRFRGMDRIALTKAYDNTGAVADSPAWLQRWRARSEAVRAEPGHALALAYGDGERQLLDYFACGAHNAPLFVFLHGGYWQRNSRDMFSFVAQGPMARGFDVAVVGYTLAPEARLSQIVDECSLALDFLFDRAQAERFGFSFDASKVILGGWSAGGHLAAAVVGHDARLKGALAISGIFDLLPIALCSLNDKLNLTLAEAIGLSPIHHVRATQPAVCAAVGANELPELQRQSESYAQAGMVAGAQVDLQCLPGHDHFSILDELYRPDGELVRCLQHLSEGAGPQ